MKRLICLTALLILVAFPASASDVFSWNETASSNTTAAPDGMPENTLPSLVDDWARETMAAVKRWYDRMQPTATSGGTANVQTLTYSVAPTAYETGDVYTFIVGGSLTNTGATTLNINSLGAKAIQNNGTALVGGELAAGQVVSVRYDGTQFQLMTPNVGVVVAATAPQSSFDSQYFTTDTDQKALDVTKLTLSGTVGDTAGTFRDAVYGSVHDSDTTVYTNSHSNEAARFGAFGPYSAGDYTASYKNHVGLSAYALGNTVSTLLSTGEAPGVEGIAGEAYQYGAGIVSNEFATHNPATADGGTAQSISMAALQAIIDYSYAEPSITDNLAYTDTAYGVLVTNNGSHSASAAFAANGTPDYFALLDGSRAKVKYEGIIMPGTASDASTVYSGTIINYGLANGNPTGGSYTYWNGSVAGGTYAWVDGGSFVATLSTTGLEVNNKLFVDALSSTTASAGKHAVCIDASTHEVFQSTSASC